MPKLQWKDATGYQRDERGTTEPRTWEIVVKMLGRVVVTRKHHDPDCWYLACYPISIDDHKLISIDLKSAQDEALLCVLGWLTGAKVNMQQALEDYANGEQHKQRKAVKGASDA